MKIWPITGNRRTCAVCSEPTFPNMQSIEELKAVLSETLNLGERGKNLTAHSPLLGSLPELDSIAVIHLITALEDRFGITVEDDDISASTFETVGGLAAFVDSKLAQ